MPFYEYQCQACNAQVEVLQKITDAPLKKCPECGRNKLTKLVSKPVFRLKGGGWYETDFKGDKDVKRNLVDHDKGEAASAQKAEEKPAAKPEEKSTGGAAGKAAETKPAEASPSGSGSTSAKPEGTKSFRRSAPAKRTLPVAKKRAGAKGRR